MSAARALASTLVLTLSLPSFAGDANHHPYPIGGRAVGLGGAFAAVANDASGIYYNPAGIVDATRSSLSASANLYGIELAGGRNFFESVSESLSDPKRVFAQLNIIPSEAGFISSFGDKDERGRARHAYGVGAFVPSYRNTNILTSDRARGRTYRNNLTDLSFHTAAAYGFRVDDNWRFGLSGIFNYRQLRQFEEVGAFSGPPGAMRFTTAQTTLDTFVGSLMLSFGIKAKLTHYWSAGASLTTPSLEVYDVSTLRVIQSASDPAGGQSVFEVDEPSGLDAANQNGGNLRMGLAFVVPRRLTFTTDLVLHPAVRFKLLDLRSARRGLDRAVTIVTDIERRMVVNLNLGLETLYAEDKSIALGVFTNYSAAPPIPEVVARDHLPDVDEYGGTIVFGFFSEHSLTRLGLTLAYGAGQDVIAEGGTALGGDASFRAIAVSSLFVYAFVSSTFRY